MIEKLNEERKAMQQVVKERLATALTGAFGLVAALAWNDAVRALIDYFYPAAEGDNLGPKFVYAIVVTLIVSIAVYLLAKFFSDKKPQ